MYKAFLNGKNEVPPVQTLSSGDAIFELNSSGTQLRFALIMRNVSRATQAHIHLARPGLGGPIAVFLFGPNQFGISVRRGVIRGILTNQDLVGPLQGKTLKDLIAEFESGNAYINVHTNRSPEGEIRGQVKQP
ncbi:MULTISPECIES: CHRD domain-containing protein [Paenibacillus]|uniref:CHRD domain-containing protein n=1 Tax=Paenibacillus violae TaxID=3077234 RepID=A0ABU3RLI4_9BACL|nr:MULTISPECIES: CHRD domain-containing protein [Paenibacillus]MDU0205136.1 CHRD domain-containing protein [Paenibacillus sp. PFR10]MEC0271416.1 CHRD domain-containing protein [Paenibacillus anseongense]